MSLAPISYPSLYSSPSLPKTQQNPSLITQSSIVSSKSLFLSSNSSSLCITHLAIRWSFALKASEKESTAKSEAGEGEEEEKYETYEVEVEQPYGLKFRKGRDGGTYIDDILPGGSADKTGQGEFSGKGATFEDIGEACIAKLALDNGSSAKVMLTRGMITSYKVKVWHGGKVELLHTWVEQEEEEGEVVIRGGVSSAFSSSGSDDINEWRLHGITGDSKECVQVELRRSHKKIKEIEMKQIITLREETLSVELLVTNEGISPIRLGGLSLVSYLTVSTPEATFAVGLEGSDFVETKPFLPRFGAIRGEEEEGKYGFGGEEENNYKQLNEVTSRIYTCAPRSFTLIDRGRRNSVVVGREGFEEVYMYSPGSRLESYTKSAYVCVGPSSLLNPISLEPGCVWRGCLHLRNPNS